MEQVTENQLTAAEISVSSRPAVKPYQPITGTIEAYQLIYSLWDKELITLQEQIMAVFMNRNGRVMGMASSVIIAHNHPSGNLTPSDADITLTKKVSYALALIDITLLDHLIITAKNWFSMANESLL